MVTIQPLSVLKPHLQHFQFLHNGLHARALRWHDSKTPLDQLQFAKLQQTPCPALSEQYAADPIPDRDHCDLGFHCTFHDEDGLMQMPEPGQHLVQQDAKAPHVGCRAQAQPLLPSTINSNNLIRSRPSQRPSATLEQSRAPPHCLSKVAQFGDGS